MKSFGLFLAACLVGIVLVEIGLRLIDYSRPPFSRYSELTGAEHRPNTEGWVEKENMVKIRFNADGLRGPEVPREKPADAFRILVLGDSFAEGVQVPLQALFSEVAERLLAACAPRGRRVEVLNFGVSGFGTARELLLFSGRARYYQPDLVLLLFTPLNDLRNNHPELEKNSLLPYFLLEDGELALDDSFRTNPVFQRKLRWSTLRDDIVYRLRVLQALRNSYVRLVLEGGIAGQIQQERTEERLALEAPWDETSREAWEVTLAILEALAGDVRRAGASLWLAAVPTRLSLIHDPQARAAAMAALGVEDSNYAEDRLRRFAASMSIDFITLSDAMRTASVEAARKGEPLDYFYFEHLGGPGGHWNATGHAVVGGAVADALCPVVMASGQQSRRP